MYRASLLSAGFPVVLRPRNRNDVDHMDSKKLKGLQHRGVIRV